MFNINKKVWIISSKKTDGQYNQGKIVGVEKSNDSLYFVSKTDFYKGFEPYQYKVAYVDVFTGRGRAEWLHHSDITVTDPSK
jgi:predicted transposase YdaD